MLISKHVKVFHQPKHVWTLQCIYMIPNFLIILKLWHYIVLTFNVISVLGGKE
jgi:hypothetical protein